MTEKLTAIIKLIRPINFLITFISVIVAAVICLPDKSLGINIFIAAFAASLVMASGNIINDIFDIEIDKINRPERPLPSGKISSRITIVLYFIFLLLSLIFTWLINLPAFLIVAVTNLMLYLYSKIFKRILLVGNIVVALLTGLVFIFGGVVVGNPSVAIIPALFAFLINLIREIVKDMEDVEGDRKADVITFPTKLGLQNSKVLILVITILLVLFTLYPFLTQMYNIEYFIVVMLIVNPILVYSMKLLFENETPGSLNKISNLLKLNMVFGLIAIYFGV
ncbi:MAG: geranylgeranylglycerol-phosphate geranylgeranyltransferase [bacterium]|nr:geranylgeranylglycerol-phosphate geranylgeranyltransferase [bacterium]